MFLTQLILASVLGIFFIAMINVIEWFANCF